MARTKKAEKTDDLNQELSKKIEAIMGPTPEEGNPSVTLPKADSKPKETPVPQSVQGAPELPGGTIVSPVEETLPAPPELQPETTIEQAEAAAAKQEYDDPETEKVVDEIAASESDQLLKHEDKDLEAAFKPPEKKTLGTKIKGFFKAWWNNPKSRWATIIVLILLIIGAAVYPTTRYFVMNTVGVRSSASLKVVDSSTGQPLRNVNVKIGTIEHKTDEDGVAKLDNLRLGATTLKVEKRAFAQIDKKITIGWGSNPLADFKLQPTGVQYTFDVTDFLSSKAIAKAEAISGEASAFSDEKGKLVLTLEPSASETQDISIKAEDYREEKLSQPADSKQSVKLAMVPSRKHVFISKRSGKYDIYKIDTDGKNEELLQSGTGSERDDMALAPHPAKDLTVVVSTRDGKRNSDGYLLSTLQIIDANTKEVTKVGESERFQIVGWAGNRLVYVQIAAGTSAANPKRHRLMTYDYDSQTSKELAATNFFNDVLMIGNVVYYAPSTTTQSSATAFYKINADGTNKQTILDKETWNIFRTSYDAMAFSVQRDWYDLKVGDHKAVKAAGAPAQTKTRIYSDSPDNARSVWIDQRDGKGVLVSYDRTKKEDTVVRSLSGLQYPLRWLTKNTLVYRIHTDQETADYVINLDGGEPRKIRDVTNTTGIDAWYYY